APATRRTHTTGRRRRRIATGSAGILPAVFCYLSSLLFSATYQAQYKYFTGYLQLRLFGNLQD
ncbi:MAG: hypothetical protein AAB422_06710, partial [Planctomycetota bacterium]